MIHSRPRSRRLFALLLPVVLLAGACGGKKGGDEVEAGDPVRGGSITMGIEAGGLEPAIREHLEAGGAVFGTCAGMIVCDSEHLGLIDATAKRNAFGRQLQSFETDLPVEGLPLEFLQNKEPKLRADDLYPVTWPSDPGLEWCPPGHGDVYLALAATRTLDRLLDAGLRWCFVSNADNLGAVPDPRIAAWVADAGVPFVMEVVRGTPADRKGGHVLVSEGTVFGVDHGLAFHIEPKLRTVLWGWAGQPLTEEERHLLEEAARVCEPTLEPWLSEAEVTATRQRIDDLLEAGHFPEPGREWPTIPWPPF